jgi:hypothetical protein
MATLYDIISELRREHPTPEASRALDLVVTELGGTRDNLDRALAQLESRPVPAEGRAVLNELAVRARAEGVADQDVPLSPDELRASREPLDKAQIGMGIVMGGTALVIAVLAVAAFAVGLSQILRAG